MKVLIYSVNYAPEPTSTGKYTGELGEWLAVRGHDVRVVAAPPYYPTWRREKGYSAFSYRRERVVRTDVWRCPLWIPRKPTGLKRILHQFSFAASSTPVVLCQALWRPDVVLVIEPSLACAPAALITARLCEAATWLHIQDYEVDAALGLGLLGGRRVRGLLYGIERSLMRRFGRISTITGAMRCRIVEKGVPEERSRLIPNWANLEKVRPLPPDEDVRRQFGATAGNVLVIYAGNMGEKQGLEVMLEAADLLREQRDVRFALVGDGAARERLERIARRRELNNVRFSDVQPLEQLPRMLAAGDVHLVVQRQEAADLVMPSKLTNILASGRPTIATADPGTTLYKLLSEYGCGLCTAPGDARELAKSIVALMEDGGAREKMGHNARRYAEAYLEKDRILSVLEYELQALISKENR